MRKILNFCGLLVITLTFGILNVQAQDVTSISELKSCINASNICTLKNNIDISYEDGEIELNKDITIDINGYTINHPYSNALFVILDGTTIIKDSGDKGIVSSNALIFLVDGGTLKIQNGTYISNQSQDIMLNTGNVIIENGNFYAKYDDIEVSDGSLTINGGNFSTGIYIDDTATNSIVEINNGTIETTSIGLNINAGTTTINYVEIISEYYSLFLENNANVIINDGKFNIPADINEYVLVNSGGNLTINGGEFSTNNGYISSVLIATEEDNNNKTIINNGMFYGAIDIMNDSESSKHLVEINNGTFISHIGSGVYVENGNLNINNGNFTAYEYCGIEVASGKVNISEGTFIGVDGGACFFSIKDILSLTGGTFSIINPENGIGGIVVITDENHSVMASDILSSGYNFYDDDTINFKYDETEDIYYSYTEASTVKVEKVKSENSSQNNDYTSDDYTDDIIKNPKTGNQIYLIWIIIIISLLIGIFIYIKLKKSNNKANLK